MIESDEKEEEEEEGGRSAIRFSNLIVFDGEKTRPGLLFRNESIRVDHAWTQPASIQANDPSSSPSWFFLNTIYVTLNELNTRSDSPPPLSSISFCLHREKERLHCVI